jgi:hypothetical protein
MIVNGRGYVGIGRSNPNRPPAIIMDGLKLYLDAGQTSSYPGTGTVWTDLSGNGNNGTLINVGSGLSFNSANGGYLQFDGNNDYINLPICNFPSNGARSVSIWVKNNSNSIIRSLFGYGNVGAAGASNILHINAVSGGDIYWGFNSGDFYTSGNVLNTTSWFNICCTYAGGILNTTNVKIYVNSINQNITKAGYVVSPSTANINYRIGSDSAGRYFNGNISNFQFYDRALSSSEVLQNYNVLKSRFGL